MDAIKVAMTTVFKTVADKLGLTHLFERWAEGDDRMPRMASAWDASVCSKASLGQHIAESDPVLQVISRLCNSAADDIKKNQSPLENNNFLTIKQLSAQVIRDENFDRYKWDKLKEAARHLSLRSAAQGFSYLRDMHDSMISAGSERYMRNECVSEITEIAISNLFKGLPEVVQARAFVREQFAANPSDAVLNLLAFKIKVTEDCEAETRRVAAAALAAK